MKFGKVFILVVFIIGITCSALFLNNILFTSKYFLSLANFVHLPAKLMVMFIITVHYIIILILLLYIFRIKKYELPLFSFKSVDGKSRKNIFLISVMFLVFVFFGLKYDEPTTKILFTNQFELVFFFISYGVFIPFVEELLFRCILIREITYVFDIKIKTVIIIQAIAFYLPHLIISTSGLDVLFFGIIAGVFFYYSKSISYSIILHTCNNFMIFCFYTNIFQVLALKKNLTDVYIMIVSFVFLVILIKRFVLSVNKLQKNYSYVQG
jgi:membrane protease YdiL (CAAX protease family)